MGSFQNIQLTLPSTSHKTDNIQPLSEAFVVKKCMNHSKFEFTSSVHTTDLRQNWSCCFQQTKML